MLLVIAKLSPVPGVFPLIPPPLGRDYHEPPIQVLESETSRASTSSEQPSNDSLNLMLQLIDIPNIVR